MTLHAHGLPAATLPGLAQHSAHKNHLLHARLDRHPRHERWDVGTVGVCRNSWCMSEHGLWISWFMSKMSSLFHDPKTLSIFWNSWNLVCEIGNYNSCCIGNASPVGVGNTYHVGSWHKPLQFCLDSFYARLVFVDIARSISWFATPDPAVTESAS